MFEVFYDRNWLPAFRAGALYKQVGRGMGGWWYFGPLVFRWRRRP